MRNFKVGTHISLASANSMRFPGMLIGGILAACLLGASGGSGASDDAWHSSSPFASASADEQTYRALTTHRQLVRKLRWMARYARNPVQVGPLVDNRAYGLDAGLVDIDGPLDTTLPVYADVCGQDVPLPSIREAVLCTIEHEGRGNTIPGRIGFSTQGRPIWGARLGAEDGIRVLVITQQHGNEVYSTEAALRVLRTLARSDTPTVRTLLQRLNILFIVRANPDGGEPSRDCQIGTPIGQVIEKDCALTRTNVDPQAGGGFLGDSEADFRGVVGVGYNLNRYHFVDLSAPIRPVETQAMVAVAHAWRPHVVLDLHGDIAKTSCEIDLGSINFVSITPSISLPSADCLSGSTRAPVVFSPFEYTDREDEPEKLLRSRTLASRLAHRVQGAGFGLANRFAQINTGAGSIYDGEAEEYEVLGALVSGWESRNFELAVSVGVESVEGGVPQLGLIPDRFLGDRYYGRFTRLNRIALEEALTVISEWTVADPSDDADYCAIPLTTAVKAALPEDVFGPTPGYGPYLVPLIGQLLQVFDDCPYTPEP